MLAHNDGDKLIVYIRSFVLTHFLEKNGPMISLCEYDQEIPQSHIADQLTASCRRATEHNYAITRQSEESK